MVSRTLRCALESGVTRRNQNYELQTDETVSNIYPRFSVPIVPPKNIGGRHFVYSGHQADPVKQVLQVPRAG